MWCIAMMRKYAMLGTHGSRGFSSKICNMEVMEPFNLPSV